MQTSPTSARPIKVRAKRKKRTKPPIRAFNRLSVIIPAFEKDVGFAFTPNQVFYQRVGINRKRWGFLLRNEVEMTTGELLTLADFFKVSSDQLLVQTLPEVQATNKPKPITDDSLYYTRQEVIKNVLRIGETTYAKWVKDGLLKQYKPGNGRKIFHSKEDVDNLIKQSRA